MARFALALAASLALHLAVVFGVQIKAAQPVRSGRGPAMEVRIERAAQAKISSVDFLTVEATADTGEK